MYFVFYIVDGWSVEKLTGSMSVFVICLLHFRLTVDREADVPVWVVLGRSCSLCSRSWAALGAHVGGLGPLLGLCGRSGAEKCEEHGCIEKCAYFSSGSANLEVLGPMLAVLGRSWDLCWRSWAALRAYVGGLGSGSGPMWAVLGADQGLS